jgi:hypothetical protein
VETGVGQGDAEGGVSNADDVPWAVVVDVGIGVTIRHRAGPHSFEFETFEHTGTEQNPETGEYDVVLYEEATEGPGLLGGTADIAKAARYVHGFIKWDGCSHLYFGDDDGYLHVCGSRNWVQLTKTLDAVLALARSALPTLADW